MATVIQRQSQNASHICLIPKETIPKLSILLLLFLWKSRELVGLCKKKIILNDRRAKKKKNPPKQKTHTNNTTQRHQPTNKKQQQQNWELGNCLFGDQTDVRCILALPLNNCCHHWQNYLKTPILNFFRKLNMTIYMNHVAPMLPCYKCSNLLISSEGNGTPLQYSCLENPMDGGAWWATVHGVAKSRARLSNFTFTFHFHALEKEMATQSSILAWRIPGTGA